MNVAVRTIERRDEWNALVLQFPNPDFRQSYEWSALRARQGWTPLRVAAFGGDECLVAMSVLARRVPGLGPVLYAPRGPLIELKNTTAWTAMPALLGHLRDLTRGIFLRVSPRVRDDHAGSLAPLLASGFRALPDVWSVWNTPRNIMRLDLGGTERDVLLRMAAKRRQHISAAGRRGVTAEVVRGLDALRAFYPLLVAHAASHGYPLTGWPYVEGLWEEFGSRGALALVHARVAGEVVTTFVGIRFGPVAHSIYAASTPAARDTWAGDVAHWEFIRWAREGGCAEIDFGSSCTDLPPTPTHPNYGIYKFKLDLGARLTMYAGYYDYVFAPLRYQFARQVERQLLPRARRTLARWQVARLRRTTGAS